MMSLASLGERRGDSGGKARVDVDEVVEGAVVARWVGLMGVSGEMLIEGGSVNVCVGGGLLEVVWRTWGSCSYVAVVSRQYVVVGSRR
jgi:hypothetical protein